MIAMNRNLASLVLLLAIGCSGTTFTTAEGSGGSANTETGGSSSAGAGGSESGTGGAEATGGAGTGNGGTVGASGGDQNIGGSDASGGAVSTGGTASTGGAQPAGGSGGAVAAGGSVSSGGMGSGGEPAWTGAPSCKGDLRCGNNGCCDSIQVPGGTFPMGRGTESCTDFPAGCTSGCTNGGAAWTCKADETPEHSVSVSSFKLDRFEVTVGRFRKFFEQYDGKPPEAGAGSHPKIAGSGWLSAWNNTVLTKNALATALEGADSPWTPAPGVKENYPIGRVTWYEAFMFCAWDGGRLPTEAEWEYAAAGGSENRLFPWGSKSPADVSGSWGCAADSSCLGPVGSYPATGARWGHQDLAGGMYEWTLDWYSSTWYSAGGASCTDCANLTPGAVRTYRGGAYSTAPSSDLRAAFRKETVGPTYRGVVGFRCARD